MHVIKDAVHKDILVSDFEIGLVDSPEMQRLRNIKQLGHANLVYPSAVHTRFEHSVGVMHLAGRLSDALGLDQAQKEELKAAGLLHDIGHFPFSHNQRIEGLVKKELKKDHIGISIEKIKSGFEDILAENSVSSKEVCSLVGGKGKHGRMLSSGIDIDKMDYLLRDAYFTGTAYGVVDLSRIMSTAIVRENEFGFISKGLKNIEAIVISRYLMFSAVYLHQAVEVAMEMLGRCVQNLHDCGAIALENLQKMDDIDLVSLIRKEKEKTGVLLDQRNLHKAIKKIYFKDLDEKTKKRCLGLIESPERLKSVEDSIANELGLGNGDFLIHVQPRPKSVENAKILEEDRFVDIKSVSPLTQTLEQEQESEWKILLISKKESRNLGSAAEKLFFESI